MNVIGMISGTSYDAIEAVALEFALAERTVHDFAEEARRLRHDK